MLNRISDFRHKEVININDGRRLGFVSDLEVDLFEGRIMSIIIPGPGKYFWFFGRETEYVIPWEKVHRIGDDIILVQMDERFIRKFFDA